MDKKEGHLTMCPCRKRERDMRKGEEIIKQKDRKWRRNMKKGEHNNRMRAG